MDDNKILPESGLEIPLQKDIESNLVKSADDKRKEDDNHGLNKKDETFCCNKCRNCRKKANQ